VVAPSDNAPLALVSLLDRAEEGAEASTADAKKKTEKKEQAKAA
jgi:hypothetical protein